MWIRGSGGFWKQGLGLTSQADRGSHFAVSLGSMLLPKWTGSAFGTLGLCFLWKGVLYFFFFFKSPLFFSGFLQGLCICLLIAPSVWTKTLAFPCSPPFQILQFLEKGLPELQSPLVPKAPWAQCSAALACKDGTLASAGKRGTLGKTIMRRVLAAWNTQGMPAPR